MKIGTNECATCVPVSCDGGIMDVDSQDTGVAKTIPDASFAPFC